MTPDIKKLLTQNAGIKLDVGCGANKHQGFIGMDYREMPGVDIVHNLEQFPFPLPDESVTLAVSSHVVEHLNPHYGDARVYPLIELLIKKKIITPKEVSKYIGDTENLPRFFGFMNEMWRILKVDAEFAMTFPYALSHGMYQDPTHINFINETTWDYFDPLSQNNFLYYIYKPKPWRVKIKNYNQTGNMEVVLVKRRMDKSYE